MILETQNYGDRFNEISTQKHKPVPKVPVGYADTVAITSYAPNKITIEADIVGKSKFLVLSDTYYPGWKVLVNGKRHKLLRADYIFRAVYIRPGKHIVKFVFSPFSFKAGVVISMITGLIILTLIIYHIIIKNTCE